MHLGVAVHAVLPEEKLCGHVGLKAVGVKGNAGVPGLGMAALTEEWSTLGQHPGVNGPVRRVAGGAVLGRRRVLPEKRAALFCVALVTGLVEGIPGELRVHGRTVGTMATAAVHLALIDGMGIGL